MKDVSFGQYYPVDSAIHRLDPRLKLLFLIAFIVVIFVANSFWGLLVCAGVLLLAVLLSHIPPWKVLRSVRGVIFLVLFTAVINVFFYAGETVYWSYGVITVSKEGIIFSVFLVLRLVLLVICSSLLTYTTTPVALTDGVESLLYPLKLIRFPVHELALIMSIALRMIPVLTEETGRIQNAQKARGADFESKNIVTRIKAFIPVLVPLLISALRRADELGEAMEARCYMGGKTRTKYKKLRFGWGDLVAFLIGAAMLAGVILLRVYVGGVL